MKRTSTVFAATAILFTSGLLSLTSAQAADCNASGSPSAWGQSMSGNFEITAGQSCTYGFRIEGTVASSKIVLNPKHGSVRMINNSTFEYKAAAGYKGGDSFVIEATGKSPTSSGTSRVTANVVVK